MSDKMGVPIPDVIRQIVGQITDSWIAEAELPNKIVKFPAAFSHQRTAHANGFNAHLRSPARVRPCRR